MRFNVASTNDDVIHQRRGYVRKRVLPTINGESPNGKLHKNRMNFTTGEVFDSPVSHLNLRFSVAICSNCLTLRKMCHFI